MNKVRVSIVGLGDHCTKSHLQYLLALKELCEVRVICDINPKAMDSLELQESEIENLFVTTDYQMVLNNPNIDAVFIMTPDRFHTAQLVKAIEAGKHVFCEKPLASTPEEYKQLVNAFELAKQKKLIITTCHPRRYDIPFKTLKESISTNKIFDKPQPGKVLNFEFYFQYSSPTKVGLHTSLMFDHLNHEIDAMNFLFGESKIMHAVKHNDDETRFHVSGSREDGISFNFIGQRKLPEREVYPEYMRVNFEGGSLFIDLFVGEAKLFSGSNYTTEFNPKKYKTDYVTRFEAINRNFLESILGLSKNYLTTNEMLGNTKLAIDLHNNVFIEY